jgi:hypothetical protein
LPSVRYPAATSFVNSAIGNVLKSKQCNPTGDCR